MMVQSNGRATRAQGVSVYLMTSDEKTKIGLSSQPGRRASYMRVGSPGQIAVHATLRLPDRETAMRVERAAHKALRWCRSHGEWFQIDPRYAEGVVRLLVSGDQPGAERLARHVRRVMAINDLWSATRSPGPFQPVDHERLAASINRRLAKGFRALEFIPLRSIPTEFAVLEPHHLDRLADALGVVDGVAGSSRAAIPER